MILGTVAGADVPVVYTVDTQAQRTAISPYIYGANFATGSWFTLRRSGGNRLTGYNWENNFSNAGSDWYQNSDRYLVQGLPASQQLIPGICLTSFHDASLAAGQATILTLPMAGYVAADDYGTVTVAETAPSARWKQVIFAKGAPFCEARGGPDAKDGVVYVDECVNFLVSRYGSATSGRGVRFYSMDNEPGLWSSTHPRIHPAPVGCAELCDRSIALASAVKAVDPNAQMLGPVLYGFNAYYCLQNAPDWNNVKRGCNWFIDYYLDRMKGAETITGRRLLDVLDVHWYPEARDTNNVRITDSQSSYSRANALARMQAPRSLWDSDYHESSWIEQWYGQYLPILPPLLDSIRAHYPGTRLSITEYSYGAPDHYSGGIATADVLGIFGKYGLYIAAYWGDAAPYLTAAFRLYRDYDSHGSTFGDTSVSAATSDKQNSSIYASIFDANDSRLHLIVLNKNFDQPIAGTFNIAASQVFTEGRVWAFSSVSPTITETTPISSIAANSFTYTIPPLTACHIVLETDLALPAAR
jgi:mannan endo-1,4-beta-mannosidase